MRTTFRKSLAVSAVASMAMLTAACGSDDTTTEGSAGGGGNNTPSESGSDTETDSGGTDPMANLVGQGCDDYAKAVPSGEGSVEGMSEDPVAVAASNNPLLTQLVAAVSGEVNKKVNLVDTLNGDEFTVFAPVDAAFEQIDASTMQTLASPEGAETLTSILTYHVVPGQIAPDQITGTQTTVQGADVEVSGSGDDLKVNDATVICGGVQTANATVYLIDSVLMPPTM